MRMKILITGSNGFIGKYLCEYFKEVGHRVFECNRQSLDLLDAGIVTTFFNSNYFDLVIHCALSGRENLYELKQSMNHDIIKTNLVMWDNLIKNRHRFKRLINLGTGHEFDIETDINYAEESDILQADPKFTYGWAKNFIARDLMQYDEFYNLRLFGVFHYTENNKRFLKKLYTRAKQDFLVDEDKCFDFFNLEDITPMIDIIAQGHCKHKDINLVYKDKYTLSQQAQLFNDIKLNQSNIIINSKSNNNYTGDSDKFYSYNTSKLGLELGFLRY